MPYGQFAQDILGFHSYLTILLNSDCFTNSISSFLTI